MSDKIIRTSVLKNFLIVILFLTVLLGMLRYHRSLNWYGPICMWKKPEI